MKRVSQEVKKASLKPFENQGLPVQFLRDPAVDKEQIARAIAAERKVDSGLVCALSSMEISPSFEHQGTHMVNRLKPCRSSTNTRSIRKRDGCMRASRPGSHGDTLEVRSSVW